MRKLINTEAELKKALLIKKVCRHLGYLVHYISYLQEVLVKLSKNKAVISKTTFFVIDPFCTSHSICLNIGFWQGSFVWKCCFFNGSTFNLKIALYFILIIFQKTCFKVKVMKTFKISSNCHKKYRETYVFLLALKNETSAN